MEQKQLLERIVLNPKIMVGKPVIRGTRLTVQYILNLLAHGATIDEILQEYKGLTKEDILACLLYASETLEDTTFMPLVEAV
ncbi:protein containing DUF433 [Candidatus Desulfofervidus auxilii]|uniref:Protein containing DUF433 n=1 Tax=Desulfofervidus auxilii TaxID=1621989 RepID=A0A7V1P391_DESA2|nr:DUF433 domain-containing protein [Candidatus Desulfofervidus auxilii]CAD7781047.1 hypothetical protein BLFGPEAP_02695 [Candidatus Methanoperedenaceae archaeon GB50]AMM42104.1 protein containing DUF433 [Candidatus Desulfofervidus auxilii]MDL1966272.1 DUF433 domain-containing protein [Candidatus Desulfofervidus auxilii]CAD7782879.1 MAG: hypothetical protein KIIPBIDF_01835 [Candidatus Methanoperedenaceae archaeon GB50]CAD7782881.1 MAG: hypothetical protein KIIPBIDF_01837 [Candidatus Methanoper